MPRQGRRLQPFLEHRARTRKQGYSPPLHRCARSGCHADASDRSRPRPRDCNGWQRFDRRHPEQNYEYYGRIVSKTGEAGDERKKDSGAPTTNNLRMSSPEERHALPETLTEKNETNGNNPMMASSHDLGTTVLLYDVSYQGIRRSPRGNSNCILV